MGKVTRWIRSWWKGKKEAKDLKPKSTDDMREKLQRNLLFKRHYSAVKIQTSFRAYLARRALRALRALVKLQALVRGYLVRRQAAIALRSIQALIRAQEKARSQRLGVIQKDNFFIRVSFVESEDYRLCATANNTPRCGGYMARTRSFEAKARSLSQPKQRPEREMERKRYSVSERREKVGEELQVGLLSPGKVGQRWRERYS